MKKALVINDSKFENLILHDMLTKLEYDVEIATEFDAFYEVEQFHPHLVIVNYVMEETTGDIVIAEIKDKHPEAVCLLSSSSSIHKDEFPDVDGILRTPVTMFTLRDLLNRVGEIKFEEAKTNEDLGTHFCPHCDKDISAFASVIVFCPFCGDSL